MRCTEHFAGEGACDLLPLLVQMSFTQKTSAKGIDLIFVDFTSCSCTLTKASCSNLKVNERQAERLQYSDLFHLVCMYVEHILKAFAYTIFILTTGTALKSKDMMRKSMSCHVSL